MGEDAPFALGKFRESFERDEMSDVSFIRWRGKKDFAVRLGLA